MTNKVIKSVFDHLQEMEIHLNQSQVSFVGSLKNYFNRNKMLSDKQIFILNEISKYVQIQIK